MGKDVYLARSGKQAFTTGQVAKILKVAPRTVSKWFDSGRLRGYRIPAGRMAGDSGGDRRIPRVDLLRFMRAHDMRVEDAIPYVLLVAVQPRLVDALRASLPADSCAIDVAETAFAAGVAVERRFPDVVVVDAALGRSDGIAVGAEIAGQQRRTGVVLAGEDEADAGDLATRGRFDAVFTKPFDPAMLAAYILEAVS